MLMDFNFQFKCACGHASHPWQYHWHLSLCVCPGFHVTELLRRCIFYYSPQRSCGKAMFSQASMILFTAGMYMAGGHAWQGGGMHSGGTCIAGGHAWQGVCMAGGVHGRGCAWQGCAWQGGHAWQEGMHGRGHTWQGGHVWQERQPLQRTVKLFSSGRSTKILD